jgi:dihydroorotase
VIEYINGKILVGNKFVKRSFLIKEGILFFKYSEKPKKVVNLEGKYISPGFFDVHVHTRTPGFAWKDDLNHVQESAMSGGVTMFIAMANTNPEPVNSNILKNIQEMMNKSFLKIYQSARITNKNNLVSFSELSKLTKFFSDDGNPICNPDIMKNALINAKKYNCILFLHENDCSITGNSYSSQFSKDYNITSFSHEYETNIIRRDIQLNQDINAKIHIQHISTKEGLLLFKNAKKDGMNISAEITPHHLCINNTEILSDNANYKMNPPLGNIEDQKALINAFKAGIIDIIATDHAPHSFEEKNKGFELSAFGIINLESAFAAIYTKLGFKYLLKIVKAFSINPAKLVGIDLQIKNNSKANITIIDPHLS